MRSVRQLAALCATPVQSVRWQLAKHGLVVPREMAQVPKAQADRYGGNVITMVPGEPGQYYVLLGPKDYEKEGLVLARWNGDRGQLEKATLLPKDFVAEGVTPIPGGKVLVVDDVKEMILIATEH